MSPIRLRQVDAEMLECPGKRSAQIVSRRNAPTARTTITRVVTQPGATSPRHQHDGAEQTWMIEQGRGRLLTAGDLPDAGARRRGHNPAGETHGVKTLGDEVFIYLTVTTPPEDMAGFYDPPAKGPASD